MVTALSHGFAKMRVVECMCIEGTFSEILQENVEKRESTPYVVITYKKARVAEFFKAFRL